MLQSLFINPTYSELDRIRSYQLASITGPGTVQTNL